MLLWMWLRQMAAGGRRAEGIVAPEQPKSKLRRRQGRELLLYVPLGPAPTPQEWEQSLET